MTEIERQNAVSSELRDGDFRVKAAVVDFHDDETRRLARVFGVSVLAVLGLVGSLAVLSVSALG